MIVMRMLLMFVIRRTRSDSFLLSNFVTTAKHALIIIINQHLRHRHFLRQEAMDMLVFNAQKLNNAVKETVRAAEAASIRVR